MDERVKEQAMRILEDWLGRDSSVPARVYRALHTLWEEATPDGVAREASVPYIAFDGAGKCLKCGSRVSLADETNTAVLVGNEIIGTHEGDMTNRNCIQCTYPDLYPDYAECDREAN